MPSRAIGSGIVIGLAAVIGHASAVTPNLDFNIHDEASYQAFRAAVSASEHARYDYVNDRRPRIAAAAAALAVYATRNPLATAEQLTAFVNGADAFLAAHSPGDPDLQRSSNLLAALRFLAPSADPAFVGTDTDVGEEASSLLGLDIPEPDGFESMQRRMVQFDRARFRGLANSREWSSVLIVGFSGRDLGGAPNGHLAGVLQSYLESQDIEPVPDGVDDGRFVDVDAALASMPANYIAYEGAINGPVEGTAAWTAIAGAFQAVADSTNDRFAELQAQMANEPTLVQGVLNAQNQAQVDQTLAQYRARIDEVAAPRTIVAVNALLLHQSQDAAALLAARQAEDFSSIQLETNDTIAAVGAGVQIVGGIAQAAIGFASIKTNPGDAVEGLMSLCMGGLEMAGLFGPTPPPVEEQVFDQIVEMRQQVEDMRVEMNERFDRIEVQLNIVYEAVATGFNALGDQIGDLTQDVDDLSRDMAIARASLERIEDALWGVGEELFMAQLTLLTNSVLDYRDDTGADLSYDASSPNFVTGASDLFSWAASFSKNTVFAGDSVSSLTILNAVDRLNGDSIGRNVNDLRVFPTQLGLPALGTTRVAASAPWTQSASAYAQLAKESPWYFAYMYANQLNLRGGDADLDAIIGVGESLASTMAAGRSEALFEALFDGYMDTVGLIRDRVAQVVSNVRTAGFYPPPGGTSIIDPGLDFWGGPEQQSATQWLPSSMNFTHLEGGPNGNDDLLLPSGIGQDCWDIYGPTNVPELCLVLLRAASTQMSLPQPSRTHTFTITANGNSEPNDLRLAFQANFGENNNGLQIGLYRRYSRVLNMRITGPGGDLVQISSDSQAFDLIVQDLVFWTNLRSVLLNRQNLEGTSFSTVNGDGSVRTVTFTLDIVGSSGPSTFCETYIVDTLDRLQDEVWTTAAADPNIINDFGPLLPAYETLIEAYCTYSFPDLMESSAITRATLRADPLTGELSLSFPGPVEDFLLSLVGDGDEGQFVDVFERMEPRTTLALGEIQEALMRPDVGQSYIDFTLAELRDLRENAFRLAKDDTYRAPRDGALVVPADAGVLANDVDQEYRVISLELSEGADLTPMHGSLSMNPDGSFAYTPDEGFAGTDSFTYRSYSFVSASPTSRITSDPAVVVILVPCPGDTNGDNVVDFADLNLVLSAFNTLSNEGGYNAAADLDEDGDVDFADLNAILSRWLETCGG